VQCRAVNRQLESRQRDEVLQLCSALVMVLRELSIIGPKLQHEEKAARAAAAAAGDQAAAAAAAALGKHGNLSAQYVSNCRDALLKAGLEDKLPPACSKVCVTLYRMHAASHCD
jgi:preprotein translocase subunit SecD